MARIPSPSRQPVVGTNQQGNPAPGKAARVGPPPLTMSQRIAAANQASTGTSKSDVRPLQDNDGDSDDD